MDESLSDTKEKHEMKGHTTHGKGTEQKRKFHALKGRVSKN